MGKVQGIVWDLTHAEDTIECPWDPTLHLGSLGKGRNGNAGQDTPCSLTACLTHVYPMVCGGLCRYNNFLKSFLRERSVRCLMTHKLSLRSACFPTDHLAIQRNSTANFSSSDKPCLPGSHC